MKINLSPWIHELRRDLGEQRLQRDIETDIAIIGAGIAGVATSFFVLRDTGYKVVLLDAYKLAHGATGHNAGQVVARFERPFADFVREYGLERSVEAEKAVNGSWDLLDEIMKEASLRIRVHKFTGYSGIVGKEQLLESLKDNHLRQEGSLSPHEILISEDAPFLPELPHQYHGLYRIVRQSEINRLLETESSDYRAVDGVAVGCFNSALFCEEVVRFLLRHYRTRFSLFEHTRIEKAVLKREEAILDALTHTVTAKKVVLCTNGFEYIKLFDEHGLEIDTKFHHHVRGIVGYMSGYLEEPRKPPAAIRYFREKTSSLPAEFREPYFYLTRRPYEYDGKNQNLISVGGPELRLEDMVEYSREYDFPEDARAEIDRFVRETYRISPKRDIAYQFTWHGLMGYTKSGVRLIGPEPRNPILLYNLGCNGIGILPSIYGGRRISQYLSGAVLKSSIFDPT